MHKVRVRFAPSPTGPLHIGGVRTALYNYLFAKKHNGVFILRIEDTDQTRFVPGAEDYIVESLKWCGIIPDEGFAAGGDYGPYRQSERKEMYRGYAEHLVKDKHAYFAFDTPEELEKMREDMKAAGMTTPQYNALTRERMKNSFTLSEDEVQKRLNSGEPYVIRIKIPRNEEIKIKDMIRGWVSVHSSKMDDKVLFKSDGMPTYHLANVVDDHLMKISHVIRGEEWLPSTPLHVLLYRYLDWQMPEFAHLPLLLRPDGNGKLSKRDGDRLGFPVFPLNWTDPSTGEKSSGYREKGYFPDAFLNMLAFLGWNPGTTQELFSLEELATAFSLERVGKAGAKFDPDKAKWFNQQYLRAKNDYELAKLFQPILKENNIEADEKYTQKVCHLMKERATFIQDMMEGIYFFKPPAEYGKNTSGKKPQTSAIMEELKIVLLKIDDFSSKKIEEHFKDFIKEKGLGFGAVMPELRMIITGAGTGPSVFDITASIGKEETIRRIETGMLMNTNKA